MITLKLTGKTYQTIESFGVSGAWWAQDVGGWEGVRDEIARLLFSGTDGIGIGCYRYNLGGGSMNSGSSSFANHNRMAECFLKNDGTCDFTRDKNAVYMLRAAVENGCESVVLFVNSPPELYTKNGKSCLDIPWTVNLRRKNYRPFAAYCVKAAEHFLSQGIPVTSISPVNEPVWVWTEKHGQEGCHYRPWGVRGVMHALADETDRSSLAGRVLISGAENGDLRWFNKTYSRIMLGDKKIRSHADGIDVHSYFLPLPLPPAFNDRVAFMKRWRKYLDKKYPGEKVRVSEWTHMKGGRDSSMVSALEQARVMWEDLTVLNAVSWQHWIAVSDVDYCDGLIYVNPDRSYEITKRYYAFGNFSKFIKKGDVRTEIVSSPDTLRLIAFKNASQIKIIAVNLSGSEQELDLSCAGNGGTAYITDRDNSLTPRTFSKSFTLSPESVTTFITEAVN